MLGKHARGDIQASSRPRLPASDVVGTWAQLWPSPRAGVVVVAGDSGTLRVSVRAQKIDSRRGNPRLPPSVIAPAQVSLPEYTQWTWGPNLLDGGRGKARDSPPFLVREGHGGMGWDGEGRG